MKNLRNIRKLAYGFCFFVTPTSVFQKLLFRTKSSCRLLEGKNHPETEFLNYYGAQESIPPAYLAWQAKTNYSYSVPSPHILLKNSSTVVSDETVNICRRRRFLKKDFVNAGLISVGLIFFVYRTICTFLYPPDISLYSLFLISSDKTFSFLHKIFTNVSVSLRIRCRE